VKNKQIIDFLPLIFYKFKMLVEASSNKIPIKIPQTGNIDTNTTI